MEGIFVFDDIIDVNDHVIKDVLSKTNSDDLTKALIREDEKIRKLFYRNMPLDDLKELDKRLKTTEAFTKHDKRIAQQKILTWISMIPEYKDTRFQSGFADIEEFEKYLLERRQPEKPYGIFEEDITMCNFFESKYSDKVLEDIRQKNEVENMGNIRIPNTNIQLINYSICPKCGHVFSFKDISDYYLNPRPDPSYKNKTHQYREDTRVFCNECETYFLPALVIVDGTPKNQVQFLCRIQTMDAIENFYSRKGIKVLSNKKENIVKKEEISTTKTVQKTGHSFFERIFSENYIPDKKTRKKVVSGIKNDVLLKEMTEKPTLISNLIQYTPSNIVMNLIEGDNVKNGDLLFGDLH
jgi:ribosomal protein L17